MDKTAEMNVLGKYASYEDLARLEYGRILWANKFGHIRRINALVNLPTPELVTPLELTEE